MPRFLSIHGHFYQPPRENPWTGEIDEQPSAAPYHDWNERIAVECYAPNAGSRILDPQGRVEQIVNNYARMSFNFGPTLLGWLEAKRPDVYRAVLDGERESCRRFSGHGSALAQAYNHAVLPLCSSRDRRTQVLWGIADFVHRFGRRPEGMWLPETAVNTATLEELASAGIRFTILAPRQAAGLVDSRRPYRVSLPSGLSMAVFFYDAGISQAVAFERLLTSGERLVERMLGSLDADGQLAHIATDGESYGHHFAHGDMALAWVLRLVEQRADVRLTNYGEYLAGHPPREEARIVENSSWSCAHGIERWRADCGCRVHGGSQAWRAPLRAAVDELGEGLARLFESRAGAWLREPWEARDAYIQVVLDPGPESMSRFLGAHGTGRHEREALAMLEMQRHALLMTTSCGWFFDDLANIETLQILRYAARALQLAADPALQQRFVEHLQQASSNLPELGDGRQVWDRFVAPLRAEAPPVPIPSARATPVPSRREQLVLAWAAQPDELAPLRLLAADPGGGTELWHVQNTAWKVLQRVWLARQGQREWADETRSLLAMLNLKAP